MVWRAGEPTSDTEVPIGAQYIRENWAYLQSVIQKCIYFDNETGTPTDDGNFQSVQFKAQAADIAINVAGGGAQYCKTVNGVSQPFFRNSGVVYKMQLGIDAGATALAQNTTTTVFNWAGKPRFVGFALALDTTAPHRTLFSPVYFDGTTVTRSYSSVGDGEGQLPSGNRLLSFEGVGATSRIKTGSYSGGSINTYVRFFGVIP